LNIAVSDQDAVTLRRIAPNARVAVIPNGVDTNYFTPRPATGEPFLIYTGGMNMFANRDAVEWFLETVWPHVKKAIPGARFFAIGQQPSPRVLAAARADCAVEAPGFVDDVRPWVARSAVFVVPLRVGGGTRLKVVDAMAQGKAIVATPLGAEGIDGVDGEHFILADGARTFADAVIGLLRDPERRSRLARAARALAVERYAWATLASDLANQYVRVIEEARR
jgi:glycosyltransferase involved in cell wall biosynthesis